MGVHDLGPLELSVDGSRSRIRGRQMTVILASLAMNANRVVPVDALIDALWGEEASTGAWSTLDSHVFRIRKQLEPDRPAGTAPSVLLKQGNGYQLVVAVDQVDSLRFAALAEQVGTLAAAGRHDEVLRRCDEALGLWRGPVDPVVADADWSQAWLARMTELRAQINERRIEALIRSGGPERALAEFDGLLRESPFREHLHALRMVALYRCGRTEEALAAFEEVRAALRDELGLTPGPELQRLHEQILNHDAALAPRAPRAGTALAAPAAAPAPPPRTPEVHLPVVMTALVGREADLTRVDGLLRTHRLVTLTGTAGTGKTRLAVEVARRCAERYPDGVWFVDLAPVAGGELIAETVLSTIGVTTTTAGSSHDALRTAVRGRRLLLLVDNCEHLLTDVAPVLTTLLDGGEELTVLATSREQLELDGELIYPVDPLGLPDAADGDSAAVELFLARLGTAAPQVVATADAQELRDRAVEICAGLDGLPLAIELAAARARVYSLEEIRDQIRFDPTQLARIGRPGTPRRRSLQSELDWGHRLLSAEEQLVHRRLAVLPGPFSLAAAAATTGMPGAELAELLPMLVNRSLLAAGPAPRPGGPTLFRQLVVVRGHAARALAQEGETDATLDRRDAWVSGLVSVASRTDRLELRRRYRVVDDDYAAVRAMLQRSLVDEPSRAGARTAGWLHAYWYYRGRLLEAVRWLSLAATALGDGGAADAIDEAWVHLGLAKMLAHQGRTDQARSHSERGLAVADRIAPEHLSAFGLDVAIQAGNMWSAGDPETARHLLTRTIELAGTTRDVVLEVLSDATRSLVESDVVEPARTIARAEQVYPRARALELDVAAWMAARAGSYAALSAADADSGMLWSDRVIELHLREGGELGGAFVEMRANFLTLAGHHRTAVVLYSAARAQRDREGLAWRSAPETSTLLDRARAALDPGEYERAWQEGEHLTLGGVVHVAVDVGSGVVEPSAPRQAARTAPRSSS
ncbi:AfsR/SARP family transcriptional regulator [Pseudonocardia humida]|uniref:Winged helix-turn-helix domain-containing protein n=1 Tax=Pseudonocardia humida TaxID=2800819 RepID=A0ABT1A0G4_9PSEU|nr:BTAD domain-containing putative transcriptional regulator [Pseudonocardia humida]MCO1656482.1 winged helix-turn-helix domain-containing protein [Pseudonocardia humida]